MTSALNTVYQTSKSKTIILIEDIFTFLAVIQYVVGADLQYTQGQRQNAVIK